MSATCSGYLGRYSCATRLPLGRIKARYSPPEESLKLVWRSPTQLVRFFPEAQTSRKAPGCRRIEGKDHFL